MTITCRQLDVAPADPRAQARPTPDEALVDLITGGDKRAMRTLFDRHNVRVFRFAARITGNPALAEDIVSEVFLEVWQRSERFKRRCQVGTWLLAIARNKALSAIKRRPHLPLDDETMAGLADPSDDPETAVHRLDRRGIIRNCLMQLSPAHREIIDLVYYHEKSPDEVARIVGIPTGTVRTRMFYARRNMMQLLQAAGIHAVRAA